MIAAILIAFLVFDDNEERVWRYGIGSTHNTMQKSSVYPAGLLYFAIPEG
jgi:hypothetical protein